MAETTQTGYGRKRGDGSEQANQQPCDPITHQYTDGSTASSSPSKETSSLANEQPPHSDGGKPNKREMPKGLSGKLESRFGQSKTFGSFLSDEKDQPFRESLMSGYENILKVAPDNLRKVLEAFWDKIHFGIETFAGCYNHVPTSEYREDPTLFMNYSFVVKNGSSINDMEDTLIHETGHFIDYMALTYSFLQRGIREQEFDNENVPQNASSFLPINDEGDTMLDLIQEELGSEEASKAIEDFIEEEKAKAEYGDNATKENIALYEEANHKLEEEMRSNFPDASDDGVQLICSVLADGKGAEAYGWQLAVALLPKSDKDMVEYAREIVDRDDIVKRRELAEKIDEKKKRKPYEYSMELSKKIGRLNDIYQASPKDPALRGRNFEGITYGHGKDYYQSNSMCATETFANICAIVCYHKDQEELLRRIAPKTMKAFDDLLAMATALAKEF